MSNFTLMYIFDYFVYNSTVNVRDSSTRVCQETLALISICSSCSVFTDNYAVEGLSSDIKHEPCFENIGAKAWMKMWDPTLLFGMGIGNDLVITA